MFKLTVFSLIASLSFTLNSAYAQSDAANETPPVAEESQESAPATPTQETALPSEEPQEAEQNTGGEGDFQWPLRFDPQDNKLSIHNPQLKYMMTPNMLDLGGLVIKASSIGMHVSQIPRERAPVRFENSANKGKYVTIVSFRWPRELAQSGLLTIETLAQQVVWQKEVNRAETKKWLNSLDYASGEMKAGHEASGYGVINPDPTEFQFLFTRNSQFRMCFSQALETGEKLRACSPLYHAQTQNERTRLSLARLNTRPAVGVFLDGRKLENASIINFAGNRLIEIKVVFGNYATIDLASRPFDPQLIDVVESKDGSEIILTGSGSKPLGGRSRIIAKPITHFWAPTGIDQDLIWQIALPRESPTIRVPGSFNIPFTLYFSGPKIPSERDRIYIRQTRSSGTYSESPKVFGYVPSGGDITSEEYSARKLDSKHFEWTFAAPQQGARNRARITVHHPNGQPWVAHYEMFRSYPYEISARLTGILSTDFTFIVLGETSANIWFETLPFTESPLFSKQRWGIGLKYHQSLTAIESSNDARIDRYSVLNADLRYHLLPGVWHRDEIFGISIGFQQTALSGPKVGDHTVQYLGLGGYWARTMPKIFDDLFNLLPFMDYPKYVDMDFTVYPTTLTSGYKAGVTFNLNFHGRVFWTERFYGEAGFGIRQTAFSFRPVTRERSASLSAAYGTMGFGYRF